MSPKITNFSFCASVEKQKRSLKIIDHFSILHYYRNDDVREAGEIPDTTICSPLAAALAGGQE